MFLLTQVQKSCRVTILNVGRFLQYCCPYRLSHFPSPSPPPTLWPLSSITIHSPSCLSLLCQRTRQPIRSWHGTGASVPNLEQINTVGLTWLFVWVFSNLNNGAQRRQQSSKRCVVRVYCVHVRAEPEAAAAKEGRNGDHVATGLQNNSCASGGRKTADSRKCLEDGCKHLVCTRSGSRVKNIPPSAQSHRIPRAPAEVLQRGIWPAALPPNLGRLPAIPTCVWCLFVGRHHVETDFHPLTTASASKLTFTIAAAVVRFFVFCFHHDLCVCGCALPIACVMKKFERVQVRKLTLNCVH